MSRKLTERSRAARTVRTVARALTAPDGLIRIPLNEEKGEKVGQIEEYLREIDANAANSFITLTNFQKRAAQTLAPQVMQRDDVTKGQRRTLQWRTPLPPNEAVQFFDLYYVFK